MGDFFSKQRVNMYFAFFASASNINKMKLK